jgi:hypothetical protein
MSLRTICLLAVVSPSGLLAQNDTAVLSGRVTDPSGLGVSNAQIRLTRQSTGSVRETVAKVEGEYGIDLLEPGDYTIRVTAPGYPEGCAYTQWHNFSPRLGLAWPVDSKTVIRAGGGIYYGTQDDNTLLKMAQTLPTTYAQTLTATSAYVPSNPGLGINVFTPAALAAARIRRRRIPSTWRRTAVWRISTPSSDGSRARSTICPSAKGTPC